MNLLFTLFLFCSTLSLVSNSRPGPGLKIVGGDVARSGQFPFAAAVYHTTSLGTYFCGGAIITNQWVLTAGQCVDSAVSFIIHLGTNILEGKDPNRLTLATSTYVLHPNYNPQTLENDLGLIKLRMPIEFNEYLGHISLPNGPISDFTSTTAIGWGQINDYHTGISNDLTYVSLTTISNDECKRTYGNQITSNMLCVAGNFNEGICNGDMGSPLIQQTLSGNFVHVGIASFRSHNGCESTDPSGYTRTNSYIDWIQNVTTSN